MYRVSIVIALCFVFAIVLTVTGQQPPPPVPAASQPAVNLDATMKAVQLTWGGLPGKVRANNASAVAADAVKLEGLFTDAQRFFQREKMQQPAEWAREAADLSGSAAKAARAGKVDSATPNGININCKQCHDVYKVKGEGGGSVLKRQ